MRATGTCAARLRTGSEANPEPAERSRGTAGALTERAAANTGRSEPKTESTETNTGTSEGNIGTLETNPGQWESNPEAAGWNIGSVEASTAKTAANSGAAIACAGSAAVNAGGAESYAGWSECSAPRENAARAGFPLSYAASGQRLFDLEFHRRTPAGGFGFLLPGQLRSPPFDRRHGEIGEAGEFLQILARQGHGIVAATGQVDRCFTDSRPRHDAEVRFTAGR